MPRKQGTKIKSSFLATVKDGWRNGDSETIGNSKDTVERHEVFDRLLGCVFWYWHLSLEEHKRRYEMGECDCFNCIIGWPLKHGIRYPLFEYEKEVYDELIRRTGDISLDKHVWIKKATGLGITEFVLRFMVWLATRDNELSGSTMCIVTGPNEYLAQDLLTRVKRLFQDFIDLEFEIDSAKRVLINNVMFQVYPANHLESARGIPDVSVFFLDEAAFFGKNAEEKDNARTISERYVGKSSPYIIQCSTPNLADDNFGEIEFLPDAPYRKVFLHYSKGLGKIYTEEEIRAAMATPSFRREYELEYLGEFGDAFTPHSIEIAEKQGLECTAVVNMEVRLDTQKAMGVDAGWTDKSRFAIVITQLNTDNNRIEVIYAHEFINANLNDMCDLILKLKYSYVIDKIFIDASNNPVIGTLKRYLHEREDYQEEEKRHPSARDRWKVVPIPFNSEGRDMLIVLKMMLDAGWLAIHPDFKELLVSLRTATAREGVLDKGKSAHNDILDALRLSLRFYDAPENK